MSSFENRPSSVYGYYDNASELGALFASPNNRDFLKLPADGYAMPHGHLIHFSRVDGGDSFSYDDFESHFGTSMWADWWDPVYYTSSLKIENGKPTAHPDKWKRLVKFWDPAYVDYYCGEYQKSQFQVRTSARQLMTTDNGSFEPKRYSKINDDGYAVRYEGMDEETFVSRMEELVHEIWKRGIGLVVNQASMEFDNWLRIHRWVAGTVHERIMWWQEGGAYRMAQWRDKIERCQMLHDKVNLFDAVLSSKDNEHEIEQACLTFTLLRGPFDFLSMRFEGHPPDNYLSGLDSIGTPIAPIEPTEGGFRRLTTRGIVGQAGTRCRFDA